MALSEADEALLESIQRDNTQWIDEVAGKVGVYCGMPLAVITDPKVLNLSDAYLGMLLEAFGLSEIPRGKKKVERELVVDGLTLYTSWFVTRPWRGKYGIVQIWHNKATGKFTKQFQPVRPWLSRLRFSTMTVAYSTAFGVQEAELKAQKELDALLNPKQRKQWLLTNSFYEKGRSGVTYWLRKNRPTVAFRPEEDGAENSEVALLCALCLHPLGWYDESYAGMMAPSDDVMAHLLMIRANEHFFWRKANQHPLDAANAGI